VHAASSNRVMVVHAGCHLLPVVDASCQARGSFAARSRSSSGKGVMNEEEPQSRQTRSLGNTKTPSSSEFLRPEKPMFTSAGNSVWLLEAQNEQANSDPFRVCRHVDKIARRSTNTHQHFG
jgi:hypothetical protein